MPSRLRAAAVMSIGWNPYFDNAKKTIEPWLLHEFDDDFYGEELSVVVAGYIRPEADFTTLDALVFAHSKRRRRGASMLTRAPFAETRALLSRNE